MPAAASTAGSGGNGFDDVVKLQLGELQSSLVTEHRRGVSRFEAKIAALEMENARLRQSCGGAHESERSKGSKSQPDEMPAGLELQTSSHGSSKPHQKTSVLSFEMPHFLDRAGQQQAKQDYLLSAVSRSTSVASENQTEFFPALPHQPNIHRRSKQSVSSEGTVDNLLLHDDELNPYEIEFAEKPTKNSVTFDETESLPSVLSTPVEQTRSMERETSSPSDPLFRILPAWDASYQGMRRKSRKLVHVGGHAMSQKNSIGSCYVGYIDDVGWFQSKLRGFMVQPISTKRLVWELVSLLLIIIDLFVIPLQFIAPRGSDLLLAPAWVAGCFWTADIFFTFCTGYTAHMDDSTVEMRPGAVAKKYLRSRFIFDLAVVSCDWVSIVVLRRRGADVISGVVLVIRAFRVFRIVGLVKARNMTDFFLERIRSEVAMISAYVLGILLLLVLLIHVTACMWLGIRDKGGEPGDTCEGTIPGPEAPFLEHYMLSFHFVLALFVGEHIELPRNLLERFFTTTVLAFAFVVTASFVGSLTTAMTRLQIIASERSAQFATLSRYLSDSAISRKLAMRVQRNAKHAYRKRKQHTPEKNVELIALISDPLRAEIHYEIYNPILVRHPFFYSYDKIDMTAMRQICHTVITEISISRGDVLFSEFEVAASPKMYFITNGKLSYNRGTWEQTKVSTKHWISEPSLWTTWAHLGSLVARAECQFIAIDATRFANITSHFSTNHASTYAQAFVQMLNSGVMTDVGEDNENTRKLVFEVFEDSLPQSALAPDWVTKGRTSVMSHDSIKSSRSSTTFLLSRSCSIEPLQSFLQSVFPVFRTGAMPTR